MPILSYCLIALLALPALAAPLPASNAPAVALALGLAPPLDPAASYDDLYSDVLGTAARAAAMNEHIEAVEEAMYESAVRHLPIDDDEIVDGGLERRSRPQALDRAGNHVGRQRVFKHHHATTPNRMPPSESDEAIVRKARMGQADKTADPDADTAADSDVEVDSSAFLLDALRAELSGRYQHTVFWKQSKLPHGFYKVAAV
ncbi:hypothetical protein CALVIDRAFT_555115 [Calocera viscosa TUFC12733]|uniref:Uncharacterized protein n=1 Tax=Calocera viscosa (strain TUFC12733) TaxID=1330018 RepID=A0A167M5M0_CALVF|nr:hypothetical protein CALVIDRAFT_555115 [Calocera viscosa TUFC12733]